MDVKAKKVKEVVGKNNMLEITQKQKEEIDFMSRYGDKFEPTEEEIEEYIQKTVYGKGDVGVFGEGVNRLFLAKRRLDIQIKYWQQDMLEGLLGYWEILEEFDNHPYIRKVLKNIAIAPEFKNFSSGEFGSFCLAFTNHKEKENLTYPLKV